MGREFIGLEGLGWEDWKAVVVPGEREWRKTQYQKHMNSIPNGPEPHIRWPHKSLVNITFG